MSRSTYCRTLVTSIGLAATLLGTAAYIATGAAQEQTAEQALRQARVGGSVSVESDVVTGVRRFEPSAALIQLGVIPFGGGIEFLEPVTDAQYNGESR